MHDALRTPALALAVILLSAIPGGTPATATSFDSDWKILRLAAEEPEVASELDNMQRSGYQAEPPQVILLGALCLTEGCSRNYLVIHPFTRNGSGAPEASVLADVRFKQDGTVLWVRLAGLQHLEIDRDGHRRSDATRRESIERIVNDALRNRLVDLEAIRDPSRQTDLVACVSKARAAFGPTVAPRDNYPPDTYTFVVRRSQDADGTFPEAALYLLDGQSESIAWGYEWRGTIADSRGGTRTQFPIGEVMDAIKISPHSALEGPYTDPCLHPQPAKKRE